MADGASCGRFAGAVRRHFLSIFDIVSQQASARFVADCATRLRLPWYEDEIGFAFSASRSDETLLGVTGPSVVSSRF